MVEAGFHQRAIRLVATGAVDAAAIDSQVLAIERRDHPSWPPASGSSTPSGPRRSSPLWPPAASRAAEGWVRELLVGLADDPAARPVLDYGFIQGFTAIDDAAYDDIRAMLATIEAAGWTGPRPRGRALRRNGRTPVSGTSLTQRSRGADIGDGVLQTHGASLAPTLCQSRCR